MFEDLGYDPDARGGFDRAEACLNGHITNAHVEKYPDACRAHCGECGAKTIQRCDGCKSEIIGLPFNMSAYMDEAAAYCHGCGSPYPWTLARMKAAQDYIDELLEVPADEREKLKGSLADIAALTAGSETALLRFKKVVAKVPQEARDGLVKVVFTLAAEGLKGAIKVAAS